jgi:hypothetical protein
MEPKRWPLRFDTEKQGDEAMGRGILLWLLGVPIPIIILLALIWH